MKYANMKDESGLQTELDRIKKNLLCRMALPNALVEQSLAKP